MSHLLPITCAPNHAIRSGRGCSAIAHQVRCCSLRGSWQTLARVLLGVYVHANKQFLQRLRTFPQVKQRTGMIILPQGSEVYLAWRLGLQQTVRACCSGRDVTQLA